jgi:hypothetical protein
MLAHNPTESGPFTLGAALAQTPRIQQSLGVPVSTPWLPRTEIGDVIVHHAAPRVWIPATVVQPGDLHGQVAVAPKTTRDAALTVAQGLVQSGRCIYIYHRDDAQWEQVRPETV